MEADYYTTQFSHEETHWWYIGRRGIIADTLARLAPAGASRALEVGCGGGGNLALLRDSAPEVSAIEMEPSAVQTARQRNVGTVWQARLGDDVPALRQRYDVVAMFDVLEHIEDDAAALREIRGLLSDGGRLFLTVPAYQWLWSRHDEVAHHQRRYTRRRLQTLLAACGFRTVRASYFNALLFPLACLTLLLSKLLPLDPERAMTQPAAPINAVLRWIFLLEVRVLRHLRLPFGLSILVVAERARDAEHRPGTAPDRSA